jgi:hypothetical protein
MLNLSMELAPKIRWPVSKVRQILKKKDRRDRIYSGGKMAVSSEIAFLQTGNERH